MNNDAITINDDVTYPRVTFLQIDTGKTIEMYDVTDITFDDINLCVHVKGKTDLSGTNKKIEMYNAKVIIKEEDDI